MHKWKWILIIGLTLLSAAFALPLEKRIRLGLDLQGGIHLLVRVETDDAVKSELNGAANALRLKLDEKGVKYGSVVPVVDPTNNVYRVVLSGVSAEDTEKTRKIVESLLRDFKPDFGASEVRADMPSQRVAAVRESAVEQAKTTIEERVNATGVAEPLIQRQSGEKILIQLPGVEDPEDIKRKLGTIAKLDLRIVEAGPMGSREEAVSAATKSGEVMEGTNEEADTVYYVVDRIPIVTGADLARAQMSQDEMNQPAVAFTLNPNGAKKFGEATAKNINRMLAIVLDDQVKSAATIRSRISDSGQISGVSAEEARDIVFWLRSGSLPAKIKYLEERHVGPFLGADSIRKGVYSGLVGLALIIVSMVIYYKLSGLNAVVALLLNAVFLLGVIAGMHAILTLPGIAGFILTLGMAVDANVLIFESIRENVRNGVAPKRSIQEGFERAFSTIIDTHLTTMLAAGSLWMLGSGPVRGFGVTLFFGLVISLFTAYFVSKTIFETFVLSREWKPGETVSI